MENRKIYTALIGAGALPFAISALAALSGVDAIPLFGAPDRLILSYGLGIVSFLTGVHWATNLYVEERNPANLFIISNVLFLLVWITFVAGSARSSAVMQSAAFLILLSIDYSLYRRRVIGRHYFRMRAAATLVAVVSLLSFLDY
jgi:hypothetical protein